MTIFHVLIRFSWGDTQIKSFSTAEEAVKEANKLIGKYLFIEGADYIYDSETGDIREVEILSSELN